MEWVQKFFSLEHGFTEMREHLLRFACYLDYKQQMETNKDKNGNLTGRPSNWGASIEEEVMAIDDIKERAFKMSNELLGAYDQISEVGKQLRDMLIPFIRGPFSESGLRKISYTVYLTDPILGQNVYKIGMTRRLEPLDRIHELSSASVPFAFDVHALIWSDDAPTLENTLHKKFALSQVNKVNFRKEFFRLSLSEIRAELEKSGLNVKWTMTAEAREYRETLAIEKATQNNPQAREDWLNHQLEIEYNTEVFDEDSLEGD